MWNTLGCSPRTTFSEGFVAPGCCECHPEAAFSCQVPLGFVSAKERYLAQGHVPPWQGYWHPMSDKCPTSWPNVREL